MSGLILSLPTSIDIAIYVVQIKDTPHNVRSSFPRFSGADKCHFLAESFKL